MTVAIMQPYLFPYLGYYQMVKAVDKFVFFDDVNFINKGWINRNQIYGKPEAFKFTVPLIGASQNKLIKDIQLAEFTKWREKFLKTVTNTYKKAPFFEATFAWLNAFLAAKEYNGISELACDSIQAIAQLFPSTPLFLHSQQIAYNTSELITGEDRILSICSLVGADRYINAKGGANLYSRERFESKAIQLQFIQMEPIQYKQFEDGHFLPGLSIIDVMMFNSPDHIQVLLNKYSLS